MYEEKCPILGRFIEEWMSQAWVLKVSLDDTSNDTMTDAGLNEVEKAVGVGGNNNESSDNGGSDSSISSDKTAELFRRKRGEGTKRRWLIKTTAISLILYRRSNRLNAFQSIVGYYLHAEGVHRGCIETCHSMGVSVSYPFIRLSEFANAEAAMKVALDHINKKKQPFLILWDNINRMVRVMMERLHSKCHMQNWTTVAIIFLDNSGVDLIGPGFPAEWINLNIRNSLVGKDFMLDENAIKSWPQNCKASIGKVLVK